jgi:hypothetical protein
VALGGDRFEAVESRRSSCDSRKLVGEWLKERRNALVDAALIYAVTEWIASPIVSAVIFLGLSMIGLYVLALIPYSLILATILIQAIRAEPPERDPAAEKGKVVFVAGGRSMYGMGLGGSFVRVPDRG